MPVRLERNSVVPAPKLKLVSLRPCMIEEPTPNVANGTICRPGRNSYMAFRW